MLLEKLTLMNEAHDLARRFIEVDGMTILNAVDTAAYSFKLTVEQREVLLHSQVLNEACVQSGVISFRKRRGRKLMFMCSGPTYSEAQHWIAWDHVDRNSNGETKYQYFWNGGGETREITQ
jgi:hypothetical protein